MVLIPIISREKNYETLPAGGDLGLDVRRVDSKFRWVCAKKIPGKILKCLKKICFSKKMQNSILFLGKLLRTIVRWPKQVFESFFCRHLKKIRFFWGFQTHPGNPDFGCVQIAINHWITNRNKKFQKFLKN